MVLAEESNIDTKATYIEIYDKTGKAVSNKLNCTFTPGLYSSVYGNNIYAAGLGSGVFCFNTNIKFTNNTDFNIYSTESKNFFTININGEKLTPEKISTISVGNTFDNAYFNNGISVFPETIPSTGLMVYNLSGNKEKILDNYEIVGGTGIYNNGMIILAGNDGDGYYHYYYNLNTKALKY